MSILEVIPSLDRTGIARRLLLLAALSVFGCSAAIAQRAPGPHIVPIDYDALFAMPTPPAYEPFEVYRLFLIDVAVQAIRWS